MQQAFKIIYLILKNNTMKRNYSKKNINTFLAVFLFSSYQKPTRHLKKLKNNIKFSLVDLPCSYGLVNQSQPVLGW